MTEKEFWFGDMRLLSSYQKAYYTKVSYEAWLHGQYEYVAFGIVIGNAFAKKGSKKTDYPKWQNPMEKFEKPRITSENLEEEFRKQQAEQNAWLFHR